MKKLLFVIVTTVLFLSCRISPAPAKAYAEEDAEALSSEEIISELQDRNRELEETHQKLFTYFAWLLGTMLTGSVILFVLNMLESRRKDTIIYNSEQFLQHSIQVQEAERKRISQELHDSVAQSLRYVSLLAENLSDKQAAAEIIATQNESIESIRRMCYNLTPPAITGSSFIPSLVLLGQKLFDAERTGFQIRVVSEPGVSFDALGDDKLMNLYRIIQEALQNIKKHAQAEEATVFFKQGVLDAGSTSLKIIITDDGAGMSEDFVSRINSARFEHVETMHFGLRNIFERTKLLGGTVTYVSEEGFGTRLTVEIPV